MTIPLNNWCSACEEACHDHPTICTVCGMTLSAPPAATTTAAAGAGAGASNRSNANSNVSFRLIPEFLTDDIRIASRELRAMLSQNNSNATNQQDDREAEEEEEWQEILLQAQLAALPVVNNNNNSTNSRPTSKDVMKGLPRYVLEEKSSLFHQASLEVTTTTTTKTTTSNNNNNNNKDSIKSNKVVLKFNLIPGEFGPNSTATQDIRINDVPFLVVDYPRTGKDGYISIGGRKTTTTTTTTTTTKKERQGQGRQGQGTVVYMERGDGITFVQKAIMAQEELGAVAVVIV